MTTATELAALRASFEAFLKIYEVQSAEAASERKRMLDVVTKLTVGQDRLVEQMAEVKPVTDFVDSFRAKIAGGLIVLGLIGTIAWAGVQFFKQQILSFLGG